MKSVDPNKIELAGFKVEWGRDAQGNNIGMFSAIKGKVIVQYIAGERYKVSVIGEKGCMIECTGVINDEDLILLDKLING